jgi:putative PIN family toxin of toxin-antitoxin system
MPRVVIDTSTLVGAVLHVHVNSVPLRSWLRAQHSYELLACRETFSEIESVLHRDRLSRYLQQAARDEFLALYRASVEWIEVSPTLVVAIEPACRDPKDNIFLALAQAGHADLVVSSDQDLLVLNPWNGIPILTPAEFLAQDEI